MVRKKPQARKFHGLQNGRVSSQEWKEELREYDFGKCQKTFLKTRVSNQIQTLKLQTFKTRRVWKDDLSEYDFGKFETSRGLGDHKNRELGRYISIRGCTIRAIPGPMVVGGGPRDPISGDYIG